MVPNRQWAYFTNQKFLQKFYVCVTKNFEPMVVMGSTKSLSLDSGDQKKQKKRERALMLPDFSPHPRIRRRKRIKERKKRR